jgi:D-inositol-3-phosphate glycosyltransferase
MTRTKQSWLADSGTESWVRTTLSDKKIVLICLHADPFDPAGLGEGGGTHSYLRELIEFYAVTRLEYIVMTRWSNPNLPPAQPLQGNGKLVRLRIGPLGPLDKRVLDDFHNVTVTEIENKLRSTIGVPDFLHSAYWNSGRAAMDLSRRWSVRFVHSVISNGWRRLRAGLVDQPACRITVERAVFHAAHRIFCISQQERRDLCEGYEIDPSRLVVVGRPVARRFLEPCRDGLGQPRSPLLDLLAST